MKDTVGKQARDLLLKKPDPIDPIEIQREIHKDYIANLEWCVKHMQKKVDCSHLVGKDRGHEHCATRESWTGDFFVAVLLKKERILENVLRNYFLATLTCPTPTWDQSVYHYQSATEELTYLWTIPDRETCEIFTDNARHIVPEERQLLKMILDFNDGTLLRKCRQLNGERLDTGIVLEGK